MRLNKAGTTQARQSRRLAGKDWWRYNSAIAANMPGTDDPEVQTRIEAAQ
jgi:hypothetical protein